MEVWAKVTLHVGQVDVGYKIKQNHSATHQNVLSGLNLCQLMCNFDQKLEHRSIDLNRYLSLQYLILIYGHELIDLDLTFKLSHKVECHKVKGYTNLGEIGQVLLDLLHFEDMEYHEHHVVNVASDIASPY